MLPVWRYLFSPGSRAAPSLSLPTPTSGSTRRGPRHRLAKRVPRVARWSPRLSCFGQVTSRKKICGAIPHLQRVAAHSRGCQGSLALALALACGPRACQPCCVAVPPGQARSSRPRLLDLLRHPVSAPKHQGLPRAPRAYPTRAPEDEFEAEVVACPSFP